MSTLEGHQAGCTLFIRPEDFKKKKNYNSDNNPSTVLSSASLRFAGKVTAYSKFHRCSRAHAPEEKEAREKREETLGGEKSGGTGREAINERKPWCRGTFEEGGQERMWRENDRSMTTITQVDLSEPSAVPGNGMIVDCRGFDRGIWLV